MAPVKIIVQGISLCHDHCSYSDTCINQNKHELERLLSTYGPVRCTYLGTDKVHSSIPREDVVDNFAHVFFKNYEDSVRACEAASNHQLLFNNSILTLTPVPNSLVPIDNLDNDALIKIFSKLDLQDKLRIEEVCPRWEELAQHSWSNVKKLDLSFITVTESEFETYMLKCGRYLEEIICRIESAFLLDAIGAYCGRIKAVDIAIKSEEDDLQSALIRLLGKLEDLKSFKLTHSCNLRYNFLDYLPESIQTFILINDWIPLPPITNLDCTILHDLQHLTLKRYNIGGLNGIEKLKKLTYLDLRGSTVPRHVIKNVMNLSMLKTLEIPGFDIDIDDDVLIKIINNLQQLERLDISDHPNLTDRSVQLISMLPNLKYLNISRLDHVTLMFMDGISSLQELNCRELDLITDEAVSRIIELAPNLQCLDITGSSITQNVFKVVNSILNTRENGVELTISTSQCVNDLGDEQWSPLLKIESSWDDVNFGLPYDDLYDDMNEDNVYGIYNEDLIEWEDDNEFELF